MAKAIAISSVINPDVLATSIANMFTGWESMRNPWLQDKKEIRDYVFATSTASTTNSSLPWKNTVHIPKLCQIRDNLHANYMSALFPNDASIVWEGDDIAAEAKKKRTTITQYMRNKLRMGGFRTEVSKLVYDFIDYGNAFCMPQFVAEKTQDTITGETIPGFIGPKIVRISPLDIVFDNTASNFMEAPKIIRSIRSLASLASDIQDKPELGYLAEAFNRSHEVRKYLGSTSQGQTYKEDSMRIDGFSSLLDYFGSQYVEVLDFYGDIYDTETGELYKNYLISVIDRAYIARKQPNDSWLGAPQIFHAGWRLRPDNLYAMGPLDNLVGMQHRIDHLENSKADAFDLIIHPVMKIKGFVEDFDYGPGERIFVEDEGDVEFMHPDTTMLQADTQIALYEAKMEEMAGAPKQATGFRTPGEKTAYEVQVLENGANRVFLNKSSYFEEIMLEPCLNAMLELARRNLDGADVIRVLDDATNAVMFSTITKEDITARGKIRPIGARHFAQNANMLQNLTTLSQSPAYDDPAVQAHISGKRMAGVIEMLLNLERFDLVSDNIRIHEQAETQSVIAASQQVHQEEQAAGGGMPPPMTPPAQG